MSAPVAIPTRAMLLGALDDVITHAALAKVAVMGQEVEQAATSLLGLSAAVSRIEQATPALRSLGVTA